MPSTIEALLVVTVGLLPGVVFELGVEREVGYWRTSLGDRLLRFLAISDREWVAGIWQYASSYPESPQDLLIERIECDPKTGALAVDDAGTVRPLGWSMLVERTQLDRIEWQSSDTEETDGSR